MKKAVFSILSVLFMVCSGIAQDYGVANTNKTFRDADRRNRRVRTKIYYPQVNNAIPSEATDEKFPVVVLGHGFVMGSSAYQNFYDTLVPRGYIVVFVDTEGSFFANHDAFSKDMAFIVEAIQAENNNQSSPLSGIVDSKSALIGHSMGGGAATVAASLTEVETLVTFAPAILRINTLTPASKVTAESIVFSGSGDGVTPPEENHLPIYNNLGSDCKYFINITGGAHCYYAQSNFFCDFGENSSSGGIEITRSEQQAITFRFLNSWFDYKLKGDLSAKQTFNSDLQTSGDITYQNACGERNFVSLSTPKSDAQLIPNPASSIVEIRTIDQKPIEKVEFYNQFGQLVSTSKESQANISNLNPGHYLVKIYTKNTVINKKMVVKN
ncbi:alpha/beta hydrolase [Aquimarina sp. MMG016]|uniref:poly(ethylene terephthalate) hydrolase family protein n=1 Tax=Aquimarina sp. MMG016 TaxID=2822690 RepID=UPI001B3A3FF8|nr:alpha/beta hydrolase [Aquimarina sp. MMG016]MBQ4820005.1 alpha/beta hydrolase [Aquimarina sp. MMG016]